MTINQPVFLMNLEFNIPGEDSVHMLRIVLKTLKNNKTGGCSFGQPPVYYIEIYV